MKVLIFCVLNNISTWLFAKIHSVQEIIVKLKNIH